MRLRTRLLPLAFAVTTTFVLLEAGSCAYLRTFRGYDGEHLLNYEFDPYKNIRPTPNFRDTRGVFHNAQGFREGEDTPREKPPGSVRIFLMGGSTAYGLQSLSSFGERKYPVIRNDETIDHYLEEYLRPRLAGGRVEVINAAVTSFFSHHHLIYLNQTILRFDPDFVLFLDGFNDYFRYEKDFDQFRDFAYQERTHRFLAEPTISAWAYYTGWWLFRRSHAFHLGGHALRNLSLILRGTEEERNRIDLEQALVRLRENGERNFVKMVERNGLILRHEGVGAVFMLQPEIAFQQSKTFSDLETQIYDEMANHWQENFVEFKNRARPVVVELMERATATSDATFLDLTDIYGGVEEDVYTDYCHLTPLGNRLLAEHVGERILSQIRERMARAKGALLPIDPVPGDTAR